MRAAGTILFVIGIIILIVSLIMMVTSYDELPDIEGIGFFFGLGGLIISLFMISLGVILLAVSRRQEKKRENLTP